MPWAFVLPRKWSCLPVSFGACTAWYLAKTWCQSPCHLTSKPWSGGFGGCCLSLPKHTKLKLYWPMSKTILWVGNATNWRSKWRMCLMGIKATAQIGSQIGPKGSLYCTIRASAKPWPQNKFGKRSCGNCCSKMFCKHRCQSLPCNVNRVQKFMISSCERYSKPARSCPKACHLALWYLVFPIYPCKSSRPWPL